MISIDGSQGEGGGQILRTSLALSIITGTPVTLYNIRAGRARPGLMQQHLTCVRAAAEISGATVDGASVGSRQVTFRPAAVRPGEYTFRIGTAGSTTLVLQTILPPLLTAGARSRLVLEGGTHNVHAPPFDFLAKTFLPLLGRMGARVTAALERHGFYPRGGGRIAVEIDPAERLMPLTLEKRGELVHRRARAVVAGLPRNIAERELSVLRAALHWPESAVCIEELDARVGPGNVLLLEIGDGQITEVITAFGKRGVRAEAVARQAAQEAAEYLAARVPVGVHLADQLLLPLSLAGGGGYATMPPSLHTRTNIDVIQRFLPVSVDVREAAGACAICVASL